MSVPLSTTARRLSWPLFCTALPAISRSSLVRLAGALRTACAECTYKMEPPEPGSDDEFDQFDY